MVKAAHLLKRLRLYGVLVILVASVAGSLPYDLSARSGYALASLGLPGDFAGEGSAVLSLWVEPGVWIFRTAHHASADLAVTLQSQEVQYTKDLSQKAGDEPQLSWVSITRAGLYRLEIVTEGSWQINVRGCTCAAESW